MLLAARHMAANCVVQELLPLQGRMPKTKPVAVALLLPVESVAV